MSKKTDYMIEHMKKHNNTAIVGHVFDIEWSEGDPAFIPDKEFLNQMQNALERAQERMENDDLVGYEPFIKVTLSGEVNYD